jgi:glycerol-3-phosphate acyltransferase PlsY
VPEFGLPGLSWVLALALAYLAGSVPFAVIVSRGMGLADPRSYGSGNPGATNVLRSGNKLAALLTLFGDAAKGWGAVALAQLLAPRYGFDSLTIALCGMAAFIGHLFPVFLRFRGGKGVATAAGVLLALNLWLGLGTLATWLLIAAFFRLSSLAAIVAALFAPFWAWLLFGRQPLVLVVAILGVLLIGRHRANLRKLIAGTEPRIGAKRASTAASDSASDSASDLAAASTSTSTSTAASASASASATES